MQLFAHVRGTDADDGWHERPHSASAGESKLPEAFLGHRDRVESGTCPGSREHVQSRTPGGPDDADVAAWILIENNGYLERRAKLDVADVDERDWRRRQRNALDRVEAAADPE